MNRSPRLLLKMYAQPQSALTSQVNLRPLFDDATHNTMALSGEPTWHIADIPDLDDHPWDVAYLRIGSGLGIDETSVVFAEPDMSQSYPDTNETNKGGDVFALKQMDCKPLEQYGDPLKPGRCFAWHLLDQYSELATARDKVKFEDPRTRIAHIDTGYYPGHSASPARILHDLQRNFVSDDDKPTSAADPFRNRMFDNSGHGTGTIGILAGQPIPQNKGHALGGAPDADVIPIRVANSVILFFTSAFAQGLNHAIQQKCDVVSLSMGGLPSAAWHDAVNAAYEAGICIVAASGDCFGGLPSPHVVYPARYRRVIAACGVMADGSPYFGLPSRTIEGNFGPDSAMTAALAAWAPNIPWAKWGCKDTVDHNGAGTSSATPQIAASAALWYEKYKAQLPRDWRRVEAVRYALFSSARRADPAHFGNGIVQANKALAVAPRFDLPKTPIDDDSFAFFRVVTGLGIAGPTTRERMLNLELAQRYQANPNLWRAIPDPAAQVSQKALGEFLDALIADNGASKTLRNMAAARYSVVTGANVPVRVSTDAVTPANRAFPQPNPNQASRPPAHRSIRTYAVDPSFSVRLETTAINQGLLNVMWERVQPGPKGEYIEVVDQDADGTMYEPVDLDDPQLLAQDGFAPSEGNPQFHQQMVYAVTMTTISFFERALGRLVLWRPQKNLSRAREDGYVQRLQVYPHAFQQQNAFYSPTDVALRFGYFGASADDPGDHAPGSTIFACLSHDIVAHETTHALLDGMHSRFNDSTNVDVLAFHEGFADIVALLQHFTIHEVLENQIGKTRGDLESESILGSLAIQFGHAVGMRGALRDAIGYVDKSGQWHRRPADPSAYQKTTAPHSRGSLLVAAVFDAFLAIYKARTADLYRIYTGGSGVLKPGSIHPDLVRRLAAEATKSARHVLTMCIRALDFVPPVDITFGEYLRGLITADSDLVPDDVYNYRVAFVEAFRRRGIYPSDVFALSTDALRWRGVDLENSAERFNSIVTDLKEFADECLYIDDRHELFKRTCDKREKLRGRIEGVLTTDPAIARPLGIDPSLPFEVFELRRAERIAPNGRPSPQAIVAITQQRDLHIEGLEKPFPFYGGATLVIDLKKPELKYAIRKRIDQKERERSTIAYVRQTMQNPLLGLLIDPGRENRFGALHGIADLEG